LVEASGLSCLVSWLVSWLVSLLKCKWMKLSDTLVMSSILT
jgi:hypothetical protein